MCGVGNSTGLYYYRARYYSPKLGRFLQTDPIGTKDDLNLYAYVYNDPSNKTDPDGQFANFVLGAVGGALIAGAVNVAVQMATNEPGTDINWGQAGRAAALGAVAGATGVGIAQAVGTAIGRTAVGMLAGAEYGAIGQGIANVTSGRSADEGIGRAALAGAATAVIAPVVAANIRGAATPLPSVNNAFPATAAVAQAVASSSGKVVQAAASAVEKMDAAVSAKIEERKRGKE